MLKRLIVKNFILVETLDLVFQSHLVVLTGETGAGKSALIDALNLILGARGERDLIRYGAEQAELCAEFDIRFLPAVTAWCTTHTIPCNKHTCFIRRVIYQSGRSKCWINGQPTTLQALRQIGRFLVTIHGQNAQYALLKPELQLALFDHFLRQESLLQAVKNQFQLWQKKRHHLQQASQQQRQHEALLTQIDQALQTWAQLVAQQAALGLSHKNWEEIQLEYHRLSHVAHLTEVTQQALVLLEGPPENHRHYHEETVPTKSATTLTEQAVAALRVGVTYDITLQPIAELLDNAHIQLQETAISLKRYTKYLEMDPGRFQLLEQFLDEMHAFAHAQQVSPANLAAHLDRLEQKRTQLQAAGDVHRLQAAVQQAEEDYFVVAHQLSAARTTAAQALGEQITTLMQALAMPHGIFSVKLSPRPHPTELGLEEICFLVTPHRHLPLKPLAKIASGGELSRISLALQVATSQVNPVATLVFDEIDTGMSGAVAEQVGKLLHNLGQEKQVFCITHSPQVAASGQQHWCVSKMEQPVSAQICTQVLELDQAARIAELARMLGGLAMTPTIRAHAQEMLNQHKQKSKRAKSLEKLF